MACRYHMWRPHGRTAGCTIVGGRFDHAHPPLIQEPDDAVAFMGRARLLPSRNLPPPEGFCPSQDSVARLGRSLAPEQGDSLTEYVYETPHPCWWTMTPRSVF